jgi:mono/diheme cytochrome c family protein
MQFTTPRIGRFGLGALALTALAAPLVAVASAEAPAAAALSAEEVTKGRQLFTDNGCNACHTLADANAAGSVGPAFDGNANLDKDHVVQVITNGQGPMPAFNWLGEEDIDLMARYIVQAKK